MSIAFVKLIDDVLEGHGEDVSPTWDDINRLAQATLPSGEWMAVGREPDGSRLVLLNDSAECLIAEDGSTAHTDKVFLDDMLQRVQELKERLDERGRK